jgi:WD40 repeat protein
MGQRKMTAYGTDTVDSSARSRDLKSEVARPYVGPRPFERKEEALFFGREREARDLVSLIIANQTFVLYSQSGAGKSSLLNTKVMSSLEAEQVWVLPVGRVQGKIPLSANSTEIANIFVTNAILSLQDINPSFRNVYSARIVDFLNSIRAMKPQHAEPIVLILDQFEELFSFYEYRWQDRADFMRQIIEALDDIPQLQVVFSLREDYIAKLDAYSGLFSNRLRARYQLERLRKEAAVAAIVGPLAWSGKQFAKNVAEMIATDLLETHARDLQGKIVSVRGEFVEPVQLQVVCSNLWDSVPASESIITEDHLKASGSVDHALRTFYDATIAEIVHGERFSEDKLRRWFDSDLITPAGTRGTVFRDSQTTAGMPNGIVDTLETRHLIRGDWRAGAQWFEITHDRLLRPIRESNRLWFKGRIKRRSIVFAALAAAALLAISGTVASIVIDAGKVRKQAEASAMATRLANLSGSLPTSQLDLGLLLAVEAEKIASSELTRSNLLKQVLRGQWILQITHVESRDMAAVAYIPGTDLVAFASRDGNVLIWNYRTGNTLAPITFGPDVSVDLFADSQNLYVIPERGDAQIYSASALAGGRLVAAEPSQSLLGRLRSSVAKNVPVDAASVFDQPVRGAVFAGGRLATSEGGEVKISDQQSGLPVASFKIADPDGSNRTARLAGYGLSSDGKFLYAVGCRVPDDPGPGSTSIQRAVPTATKPPQCGGLFATLWDVDANRQLKLFGYNSVRSPVMAINHVGDSLWLAGKEDESKVTIQRVVITPADSGSLSPDVVATVEGGVPLAALAFVGNSPTLVSASGSGLLISWKFGSERRLEKSIRKGFPSDLVVSKSGTWATVGPSGYAVLSPTNQQVMSGDALPSNGVEDLSSVSLGADVGQLLISQNGAIELWSITSGERLSTIRMDSASAASVALAPQGRYMASGYVPGRKPAPPNDLTKVPIVRLTDSTQPVITANLSPRIRTPPGDKGSLPPGDDGSPLVVGVAFSPDGRYFAMSQVNDEQSPSGMVLIYKRNPDDRSEAFQTSSVTSNYDGAPYFLAFSPDSNQLAVTGRGGGIILLNPETGAVNSKLVPDSRETFRIAFSPDGKLLAVRTFDGLQLWDITTRSQVGSTITTSEESLVGIAFSSDGRRLLTGDSGLDSVVELDLSVESWIAEACDIAGRNLRAEELRNYDLNMDAPRACPTR